MSPTRARWATRLATEKLGFVRSEARVVVADLLEALPEREATIVRLRFYEDLTQSEIAERIGISQMHVSRLLRRALLQLRDQLGDDVLPEEP